MARIYRSAAGKVVDMEKLRQANEGVTALTGGTQHVNARGDELGPGGRVIRTREEIMKAYNRNNPNAVPDVHPDLVPDVPEKVPTPDGDILKARTLESMRNEEIPAIPVDEIYNKVSKEDKKKLIETEETRITDMNRRISDLRETRERQQLADQQERLTEEAKRSSGIIDTREEIFMDDVTGKTYKTNAALKAAVTRRMKKGQDNVDVTLDKTTDSGTDDGFGWAE